MNDFIILTDSTSDLSYELRQQYNVDYVPMQYVVEGNEYKASLDWETHDPKTYYDIMRNGTRIFTTQINKELCHEAFENAIKEGKEVLYISCSSALSASYNVGCVVAQELKEIYPDAKIYCVDSLISSLGQGFLVMEASRKRAEGLSAADTAAYIERIRLRVNQFGTVGSLEYLRRAGRIKASKAFFGNLFGVKPLIISDIKGQNYAYKKSKGAANARLTIAEHIHEAADGVYEELFLSHADCEEDIQLLKEEILKTSPFKKITINNIGPIVGASVGPGTVIAYCYGKEVTIEGIE